MGTTGSGKTALLQRFINDAFSEQIRPTVGLDENAGRLVLQSADIQDHQRLSTLVADQTLDVELWELGGRELGKRELPRGKHFDGLMLCYDLSDRSSFQRAAHVLMSLTVDRHLADSKNESIVYGREVPQPLVVVLCGTKADESDSMSIKSEEVQRFVQANNVRSVASTSAKSGQGVRAAFLDLLAASLEAEHQTYTTSQETCAAVPLLVSESWSLSCPDRIGHQGPFTSPRGARPFEPLRLPPLSTSAPVALRSPRQRPLDLPPTADCERLVEVLNQQGEATATRSLARCLERGLRHRAVHVWLVVPRTGALLLRRYAPNALKHPGRWGPTVHGEILCYGTEGNGHGAELSAQAALGAELSAQAAARSIHEQLGIEASEVDELEHCFSCTSEDGKSIEIVDVYIAALKGQGLPPLRMHQHEEVDWAFFGDVFSDDARKAGTVFHVEEDYVMSMFRRMRVGVVANDVMNAFGRQAAATLARDEIRGFPATGGVLKIDAMNSRRNRAGQRTR